MNKKKIAKEILAITKLLVDFNWQKDRIDVNQENNIDNKEKENKSNNQKFANEIIKISRLLMSYDIDNISRCFNTWMNFL